MIHEGNGTAGSALRTQDEGLFRQDSAQLSKLSSVLNGLEGGAQIMQRHIDEALRAVRGGTYRVDPIQLSRRIVGEALGAL
ncbi:MAG TPA: hypothetical protein VFA65_12895 [Bryobacteraceae bacterium]|nr:hypothetical protein [Bryobacteraceae bacterium]